MKYFALFLLVFCVSLPELFAITHEEKLLLDEIAYEESLLTEIEYEINQFSGIVKRKIEIRNLDSAGNYEKIEQLFLEDSKIIDQSLSSDNKKSAVNEFNKLSIIYKGIGITQGNIWYYKSFFAEYTDSLNLAIGLLSKVVEEHNNCLKYNYSAKKLCNIYINNELNDEYINLYEKFEFEKDIDVKYWYAQALYNVREFSKARSIFLELVSDPLYGFRSEIMNILIDSQDAASEQSISRILALKNTHTETEEFYEVLILLLARFYFEDNQLEFAENGYNEYINKWPSKVNNELRYEYSQLLRLKKEYDKALQQLQLISDNKDDETYFLESKALLVTMYDEIGQYETSSQTFTGSMDYFTKANELLKKKYSLLNEIKEAYVNNNKNDKSTIESIVSEKQKILEETNIQIKEFSRGLSVDELAELEKIEEMYLENFTLLIKFRDEIEYLNTHNNQEIPEKIDREIALLDSARVRLRALQYISNLPEATLDDFKAAYFISSEIINTRMKIDEWRKESLRYSDLEQPYKKITENITLFEQNVSSLEAIATFLFGEQSTENTISRELEKEEEMIISKKDSLLVLKQNVWDNYNKIAANKLEKEKIGFLSENNELEDEYFALLGEIRSLADKKRKELDYVKLEMEFRQTKRNLYNSANEPGE